MIVKRNEHNDEEVIELENGCRFHYLYNFDSLDNMKEKLEEARTAFKNNPSQINRLDMIYQAADYMWAKGEQQEAAEYLKQEIDGTGEAIDYANVVMEVAENHFYDTIEYAYACELYATALASNGELSDAETFYRDARGRLKGEISEAERLLDCIDKNLTSIKDAKDNE